MIWQAKGQGDYREEIGELLKRFYWLEERINEIIFEYFLPTRNKDTFKHVVLNSAILNMGQKTKILANMTGFDAKISGKIRELGGIRNGFAHSLPYVSVEVESDENGKILKGKTKNIIEVMNSQGKIMHKNFDDQFKKFEILENEVSLYLNQYQNEHLR